MSKLSTQRMTSFRVAYKDVVGRLRQLRLDIDGLGALGSVIPRNDKPDMLGCFASNGLYGPQALVEQMRDAVEKADRKGRGGR